MSAGTGLPDALERARAESPFLSEAIGRYPAVVEMLSDHGIDAAVEHARISAASALDPAGIMRRERGGVSLALALADLAGLLSLEQVVERLTRCADDYLDRAIRHAMKERTESDDPTGFAAIALGKQGSVELNYSSDIDPIFLFDPATLPLRPREDAGQAAVRIVRRVVDLLATRTADGHVLRVDLRLRPAPDVFPAAVPVLAAIAYYEASALPWERAAFIRARGAAGDIPLGRDFLTAVQPFVWRRSLDFGAIEDITGLSRQIRDNYAGARTFGPGYDLKRGRGGIREVEFFVQAHQLIHGGRDARLRAPATLDALAALGAAGRIDARAARELSDAYRIFRTIEHRLQMIDDRQTHSLPSGLALDAVARLHGLEDGSALLAYLAPHVANVMVWYDELADRADRRVTLPSDREPLQEFIRNAGFAEPRPAVDHVFAWRSGQARSLRSPAARAAFEAMLPALMTAIGAMPAPNAALHRFDDLVTRLPSGINLYRLLEARPDLVALLAQILGHAPTLADTLARNPQLIDGLIDASTLDPPPNADALVRLFARGSHADHESALRHIRSQVDEWRFALGVQLIAGGADPLDVAAGYARVAEAAIQALGAASVEQFAATHGSVPGAELVVLGIGRLGGEALTHASDLDLVYLFTGAIDAESDGPKPLRATDYFNRLARRVTAALSLSTAAGPLYEVDTRLRPSGSNGMLAVTIDAWSAYQASEAWTFEHMALTRARSVFGSIGARADVDARALVILRRPRDAAKVAADAEAMRADMVRHKPATGPFDVKRQPGGLIDLEFAVHVIQLTTGIGLTPRLGDAIAQLIEAGLLPEAVAPAHRLLTRLLVVLRLVAPGGIEPASRSQSLVARACGFPDWTSLDAGVSEARATIIGSARREGG